MQFIHEDAVHVVVRSETPALHDTQGRMIQPKRRRLYAKFTRGLAPAYAIELARQTYGFKKKPEEIPLENWVAHYDSVLDQKARGLSDEEREEVEQRLVGLGYVLVESPRIAAPYALYDKHRRVAGKRTIDHVLKDVTAAYEFSGFDLDHAIAYERENGNDERVIAALEALKAPAVEDEDVIEA